MGRWLNIDRQWETNGRVAIIKEDNTWEELIIPNILIGVACHPDTTCIMEAREILREKHNLPEYGKPYYPPGVIALAFLGPTDVPPDDDDD
jgi:hypothetical protein